MSQPFCEEMEMDGGIPHTSIQFLMHCPPGCVALLRSHQASVP